MTDKKNKPTKDVLAPGQLEDVIAEMLKNSSATGYGNPKPNMSGAPAGPDPVQMVSEVAASLEQGMMEIYKGLNTLGQGLDLSRLQNFMVVKILVDKGIVTEEEIEERYKTDVADKLEEMHKRMQEKMQTHVQNAVDEKVNSDNNG